MDTVPTRERSRAEKQVRHLVRQRPASYFLKPYSEDKCVKVNVDSTYPHSKFNYGAKGMEDVSTLGTLGVSGSSTDGTSGSSGKSGTSGSSGILGRDTQADSEATAANPSNTLRALVMVSLSRISLNDFRFNR